MIPAPLGIVKVIIGFGSFGVSIARKNATEEQKKYFDCIDSLNFKELKKGIDVLNEYKGLKMVEVNSGDGTGVKIII